MKSPLIVLFALSLALNVTLGLYALRPPTSHPVEAGAANSSVNTLAAPSATTPAARAGTATVPLKWPTPRTDQDLHTLVANLRQAGFPPATVRAIINQLVNDRLAAQRADDDQPFWKRFRQTPEQVAAQQMQNNQRQALLESLLGPDGRPSATLDPAARERRYGTLSNDKLDAVVRIERDYTEVRSAALAASSNNPLQRGADYSKQQRVLEQEKLADLAAVLSPDELAQYEMRNSPSANILISRLKAVDVSESEYAALYQIQKKHDAEQPLSPSTFSPADLAKGALAQQTMNEQAQAVLGDERFYTYLESADFNYARVAQFTAKYPNVTPATSYQLYQLQNEAQAALMQATANNLNSGSPQQRALEMQTMLAGYETKLSALVGPDVAAAYKKSPAGRIFSALSRVPRGN